MIEEYNLSFLNLNIIKEFLLKINAAEHGLLTDGKSTFAYGMPILMYPELVGLKKIIKQYVRMYCNKYDIPPLKFINSWFNITNPGNELKLHDHGEMGLSGAFYVDVGEKSVPLILPDTQIKPYSGLLIIFPSSAPHYTEKEQEQRIVISFNTDYQ
jgi:hypothetical protein